MPNPKETPIWMESRQSARGNMNAIIHVYGGGARIHQIYPTDGAIMLEFIKDFERILTEQQVSMGTLPVSALKKFFSADPTAEKAGGLEPIAKKKGAKKKKAGSRK